MENNDSFSLKSLEMILPPSTERLTGKVLLPVTFFPFPYLSF